MKHSKTKIAALVGTVVLVTLLLFLVIFNIVMHRRIRSESKLAIDQALDESGYMTASGLYNVVVNTEGAQDLNEILGELATDENVDLDSEVMTAEDEKILYTADFLYIPDDRRSLEKMEQFMSEREKQLLKWCQENDAPELTKANINDRSYFIRSIDPEDGSARMAAYVDVTGEYDMMRRMNVIFLIAAVVIGLFGTFAGYLLGKKMEQTQLIQKQFFENTSHELKTPLTAIRGYAEGLEKGVITDYPKTGHVIATQTEHMSRLVEEILSISKLESGSVTLKKEKVNMTDFLQDCLLPMEGVVKNRGLQVDLELEDCEVMMDPDQMEHAVTNLLTNAIKYAVHEIRVTCTAQTLTIWNDVEEITEDELTHMFDRFYTGKNGNTGIGLALAKEIIEHHDWNISVERRESGVAFLVRW